MKYLIFIFLCGNINIASAQFCITLPYKKAKCGGTRNPDTTSYFLLTNKKWIIQYPNHKIDTIYTDINGKIKIPNKKGTYYLFEPWKYHHTHPDVYPRAFYNETCLKKMYVVPDFTIQVFSNKKYRKHPTFYYVPCPDKHPCLRTDTVVPKIPSQPY